MAIDPLGTPQPVKLAILALAAARQAVQLTSDQNQQLREARLTADQKAQDSRDNARATADAKAAAARAAQQTPDVSSSANPADSSVGTGAGTDSRGERVNIFA